MYEFCLGSVLSARVCSIIGEPTHSSFPKTSVSDNFSGQRSFAYEIKQQQEEKNSKQKVFKVTAREILTEKCCFSKQAT